MLSRASQRNTISHGNGGEVRYVVTRGQPVRGLLEGCARMERSVSYGGIVDKIVNTSIGWSSLCMHNPRPNHAS